MDDRNKKVAEDIMKRSDVAFLAGGDTKTQLKFFDDINFRKILARYDGLVVGASAGAMNLCKLVACFPDDLNRINYDKLLTKGLGFYDKVLIPHFDGENLIYKRNDEDALDHLLELSERRELLAFDNDAFILVDGDMARFFGNFYVIKNRRCQKY